MQAYTDFVSAFLDSFDDMVGDVISEITLGCGPAGELRYPAYPEGDGRWRFPGTGAFQCYDKYMLASLRQAALDHGKPAWYAHLRPRSLPCCCDRWAPERLPQATPPPGIPALCFRCALNAWPVWHPGTFRH